MEIVENLVKTTLGEIEKVLSTKTVVGEPLTIEGIKGNGKACPGCSGKFGNFR